MAVPQANGGGTFYIDAAMKAVEWERAKGHLRALVALQGSYGSPFGRDPLAEPPVFERLGDKVAAFIKYVEDNGLDQ